MSIFQSRVNVTQAEEYDLDTKAQERQEEEEKMRAIKRQKRKEKKRAIEEAAENEQDPEISAVMGFGGFGGK